MKNNTIEVLSKRISLRKYSSEKVTDEEIELITDMAMRAPTAGNMMMYSIIVIKDEAVKEKLSITCDNQPFIKDADFLLLFVADLQKWDMYFRRSGIEELEASRGGSYESPSEADLMLGLSDALIAAQNAAIAAESMNIGTCYIGDIMENYEVHRDMFNLPRYAFPIAMLTIGKYPHDMQRKPRERFQKKHVVFDEKYPVLSDDFIDEMFLDLNSRSFNASAGASNYAQAFYLSKNGAEFFVEMKRSVRKMLENWK